MYRTIAHSLTSLFVLFGLVLTVSAEEDQKRQRKGKEQQEQKDTHTLRATEIINTSVMNHKDQEVGHIDELVINMQDGSLQYAALSCGGFLGVGDKHFAVPMSALKPMRKDDTLQFMTKLEKESFDKAQGFDHDNWPKTADPRWSKSIDEQFGQKSSKKESKGKKGELIPMYRVAAINGTIVRNLQGEQVGTIAGMMINLQKNQVAYIAVSTGGFLGIADKVNAVPFKSFQVKHNQDGEKYFLFDVTKESLLNAPGFDQSNWPDTANPTWSREVDEYYSKEKKKNS